MSKRLSALFLVSLALVLVGSACGGDRESAPSARPSSTIPGCTFAPEIAIPDWFPRDLPLPPGTFATAEVRVSRTVKSAEFVVPMSHDDLAKFIVERWPDAGWELGRGEAEPGIEIEQAFAKGSVNGRMIARVSCDPRYQTMVVAYQREVDR